MSVIVLEDCRRDDWTHRLHVMAGQSSDLDAYQLPAHAQATRTQDELRNWHLQATWPLREAVNLQFAPNQSWLSVVWWIGADRISKAAMDAAFAYSLAVGHDPLCILLRDLPASAGDQDGAGISNLTVWGMPLVATAWVPAGFLIVSGGENARKGK